MLTENKFGKYLLYAIGEIILVVIGILIALQINNWNEENRINKSVNSHLSILKRNLQEDQRQLIQLKQDMTENVHFADSSMLQIRTNIPVNNRLKLYMMKLLLEYQFSPNTNAIETITQSNELPALKAELQTAILDYYALIERTKEREKISNTQIQTKYEGHINRTYPEIYQKDNQWEFIKQFYKGDPRATSEIDEEKLLSDTELEALLLSRYFQSVSLEEFYGELIESSNVILDLLP